MVSTPYTGADPENIVIGPDHDNVTYLEPIIIHRWLNGEEDIKTIETPFIPEEVNLLQMARDAGLTGDNIVVDEFAIGVGPWRSQYSLVTQDLFITDMKFLSKEWIYEFWRYACFKFCGCSWEIG